MSRTDHLSCAGATEADGVDPASRTSGRTLDHAAAVYDLLAPIMTLGSEARCHRNVLELLRLEGGERVLDVGCGTGTLTRLIARNLASGKGGRAIGLDAATKMIAVAKRKATGIDNIEFDAAIAECLPYPDQSFDRILSTFFFHHIDAKLKRLTLSELWRVLRPGGLGVIVDVDTPSNFFGYICAWSGYLLFKQDEIKENIRGELRAALDDSDFKWSKIAQTSGYIGTFTLSK